MTELLEQGYQYTSVCSHRSAISASHEGIDGKNIGENLQVSSLITGIFNQRPPQPKYTYICDVQIGITVNKETFTWK